MCRDTGPGFDIASVYNQGVFWAHKHQKSKSGSGHIPSTPPHPHSNPTPFSEPYTPYKHINNISVLGSRDTGPCFGVDYAQTLSCFSRNSQQGTGGWGQTNGMGHDTFLLQATTLCIPLCLLYPSRPRAFPNQHSFPSISPSPQAILSTQTHIHN